MVLQCRFQRCVRLAITRKQIVIGELSNEIFLGFKFDMRFSPNISKKVRLCIKGKLSFVERLASAIE